MTCSDAFGRLIVQCRAPLRHLSQQHAWKGRLHSTTHVGSASTDIGNGLAEYLLLVVQPHGRFWVSSKTRRPSCGPPELMEALSAKVDTSVNSTSSSSCDRLIAVMCVCENSTRPGFTGRRNAAEKGTPHIQKYGVWSLNCRGLICTVRYFVNTLPLNMVNLSHSPRNNDRSMDGNTFRGTLELRSNKFATHLPRDRTC